MMLDRPASKPVVRSVATDPDAVRERDDLLHELREALASIRRHPLIVLAVALAALSLATAFVAIRPPDHVSVAQVLLDPRGLKITENELVPASSSSDVNDAVIETQVRLLTSDVILARVVRSLGLQTDPDFARTRGFLGRLKDLVVAPEVEKTDPVDSAASLLARQVTAQRQGKSFVVHLSVRTPNPEKGSRIANDIVRAFLSDLDERRRTMIAQARASMAATLVGQRDRLAQAEDAVELYKRSIGIVDADGRVLNTTRMSEANSQLLAARALTSSLAARVQQLDALQRAVASGTIDAGQETVESALLTQLKASRAELGRQQENLRTTLGARHPQLLEIDAQVRSLNRAIAGEIARVVATARSDHKAALARQKALEQDVSRMQADTSQTNLALVRLRQLEREAVAQRSVYEKFLERERELREQETVGGTNASVVAEAKPSPDPAGFRPSLLLAAATLFGLLLGFGASVAYERFGDRIFSPARMARRTGLTAIAVLPLPKLGPASGPGPVSLLGTGSNARASRTLYGLSEALEAVNVPGPVNLLIVSPSTGPARAIISSNLAAAEAGRGREALLIDADARGGHLGWLWRGRTPTGGCVSCVIDDNPPFSAVAVPDSAVLWPPAGMSRATGSDFDSVITDASSAADDLVLRRLADAATAILVVVEQGSSSFTAVQELQASLARNSGKVLGALFVVPGQGAAPAARARIFSRASSSPRARSAAAFGAELTTA